MTDNQSITLGGQQYSIPKLTIKQNRYVEVLATRNYSYFAKASSAGGRINLLELTDEQAADFTKIVYHTLTRVQPSLTFEQFEELPISMKEIMIALPVCIAQSGLYTQRAASGEGATSGEAPNPLTGTG